MLSFFPFWAFLPSLWSLVIIFFQPTEVSELFRLMDRASRILLENDWYSVGFGKSDVCHNSPRGPRATADYPTGGVDQMKVNSQQDLQLVLAWALHTN